MRSSVRLTIDGREGKLATPVRITAADYQKMVKCQAALKDLDVNGSSELTFPVEEYLATVSDGTVSFANTMWQSRRVPLATLDALFNVRSATISWETYNIRNGPAPTRVTVTQEDFESIKRLWAKGHELREEFPGIALAVPATWHLDDDAGCFILSMSLPVIRECELRVGAGGEESVSIQEGLLERHVAWHALRDAFEGELV